MSKQLDDLTNQVEATRGVVQSAIVLIQGFGAALASAGTDPVKLGQLAADLKTQNDALAAAVAANPLPSDVPPAEPPV